MATSNLLSTSTPNLKTLLGNGRQYGVPPFQWDYSWKTEHWEDLWLDLMEITHAPGKTHYMGSIVIHEASLETFTVIDGQQRLATLTVLILAVIAKLERMAAQGIDGESNRERARLLRNAFVGAKSAGSLIESSKLTLNRNNNDFFQSRIVQLSEPTSVRSLNASNKKLYDAFRYFSNRIDADLGAFNGEALATWVESTVSVRLLFIQVNVEDEIGAYTVFETLNARGLNLTSGDLIKNYLMSIVAQLGDSDLDYVLSSWHRVVDAAGASHLPEFLRHFINSRDPFVRQERLFRRVREAVKQPDEAIELVQELERASVCYSALSNPDDEFWLDFAGAEGLVRALTLFQVGQYRPLALAAHRHLPADEFVKVLRDCVVISFRFNVIGRRGTHDLERQYNEAAIAVSEGAVRTAAAVRERLRPIYVGDEEFRADFRLYRQPIGGAKKKLIRYILCELERQHSGDDLAWETSRASIEHVLPVHHGDGWEDAFTSEQHANFVDRLGNYAMLEAPKNCEIGDRPFDVKARVLLESRYSLTQEIGQCSEWTPEEVNRRQSRLADLATAVWRLPS